MSLSEGFDANRAGLAALRYALQEQAEEEKRKQRLNELLEALGISGELEDDEEPLGSVRLDLPADQGGGA